jgi:hypothetical protein
VKRTSFPSLLELAILAYCLWQASDLPKSWLSTPAVKYAWIAFIIWCLPSLWHMAICILYDKPKGSQPWLLGAAILMSLLSELGSLHMFAHIGLTLAIAGLVPFNIGTLVWIASALSWLPGFGWMLNEFPFALIPIIQLAIAICGTTFMFLMLRRP